MNTTTLERQAVRFSLPLLAVALSACSTVSAGMPSQVTLKSQTIPLLHVDGKQFKDLNRNGVLDAYEDWRLPAAQRARDLVRRMTLEEKAGTMMHANPPSTASASIPGAGTAWELPGITTLLLDKHITSFLNRLNTDVASMAEQHNRLQQIAERGRLGIPVSLSTDPRSQFRYSQGISVNAGAFTQWPDPVGMAAIADPALVRAFAASVRQEYLAVGIRIALSPQADLALNPRWHRFNGAFGGDPALATDLVRAYVDGMQNGARGIGRDSVVSVVKHWVGYGATMPDGYDAHNYYGRHLAMTSESVEQHIAPFTGAFAARVGGVMPAYGLPPENLHVIGSDAPIERVGMGFNKQMLTDVLRGRFGFDGVIVSDWHITDDCKAVCRDGAKPGQTPAAGDIAMPWGVEALSKGERFAKAVVAGVDQFGGGKEPEFIIAAVRQGRLDERQVDASVQRILLQKFQQGLFENPYVDVAAAAGVVGSPAFQALSLDAQRRSLVLIKNDRQVLPLRAAQARKLYLYQIDASVARQRGFTVVDRPEDADVALMALTTPHEMLHPGYFFGSRYREGDTGFRDGDPAYEAFKRISARVPTVVSLYLERPADVSAIAGPAAAIVGNFGVGMEALFDVLTGQTAPSAKLPYDLPVPEHAMRAAGVPLAYRRGQGLTYFGPEQFTPTSVTRHASFYVGGSYVGEAGKELMDGQMYVQAWAPARITRPYPLVLLHGLGQTATNWMSTPDGRAGWADYFVDQGYVVYMVDQPSRGRSAWLPETGGKLRTSNLALVERLFTAPAKYKAWPQAHKHTQWPGAGAAPGQRGDPLFDGFYAGMVASLADNKRSEELMRNAGAALLDKIGPAVVLAHSQAGLFAWSIADARPGLVKAIVAVEPSGPPFQNATQQQRELAWGLTNIPVRYDPAVSDPAEIQIERQAEPDSADLVACWRQREPARKLANLQKTPVLLVTGEASYHAPYDHCTAAFLRQAGVPATFWRLEHLGIKGNGHLMMQEKNSLDIAQRLHGWISANVK